MNKFIPLLMALVFLTGGTAWAKHKKKSTAAPTASKSHSSKKSSKKKTKKGAKSAKGSKTKEEIKTQSQIGKSDVTIDLKGE